MSTPGDSSSSPVPVVTPTDDIVVTARKRAERTVDVPTSITAMGSAQLERYGTTSLQSLNSQVPQLQITSNPSGSGAVLTIRGIGTNNTGEAGVEQAVSLNIDGVPTSQGRIIQVGLFDVDNLEVLKGPQALYFGKNSPGGAIIVNSKGPTDRLEGYVRAGYEFAADEYKYEGAIGGPITDTLGFRIAGQGSNMLGGYVRNVAGPISATDNPVAYDRANGVALPGRAAKWGPGTDQYAGRLTLAWKPDTAFKATFKFLASRFENNGESSTVQLLSCPAGFPNGALTDLGALAFGGPPGVVADPYGNCNPKARQNTIGALPAAYASRLVGSNGGVPFSKTDTILSSLNLSYDIGNISLTSITGFYKINNSNYTNLDYSTFDIVSAVVSQRSTTWTQEFRAVSSFNGPINFNVGAYYEGFNRFFGSTTALARAADPNDGPINNGYTTDRTNGHTLSAVGELILKPVANVEIAGGARYTREVKDGVLVNEYVQPGLVSSLGIWLPQGIPINAHFRSNNVSPQVTVSWHPARDVNIFFGYRTGYKSGGISNPNFVSFASTPSSVVFGNEKVSGYEGGVKFETPDRKLSGDLTLYHYIYKGLQVSAFDAASNNLFIQNAGGAQLDGVEGSLSYRLNDAFSAHGSVSYNRARYTQYDAAQCWAGQTAAQGCSVGSGAAQDLSGRPLTRAPDWSATAGATWDHDLTRDYKIGLSVDGRYSSSYYYTTTDSPYGKQAGYFLLDASVRLRSSDRFELAVVGKNLTNKFYAEFGSDRPLGIAPGSIAGIAGLPRTVMIQTTFNF